MRLSLGFGLGVDETLVAGVELGLGIDIGIGVGIDVELYADGIVNIFCSCCVDTLSEPFEFLSLAVFLNSSVMKHDELDLIYYYNK